jgi:beta-hydroxylase
MDTVIFRIATRDAMAAAAAAGVYGGEAFDKEDGFIHCSTREQVAGTLETHHGGAERLAVAEIDAGALGGSLKWEASRAGALFPHVYADIPWAAVKAVHLISRDEDGAWRLPSELCP